MFNRSKAQREEPTASVPAVVNETAVAPVGLADQFEADAGDAADHTSDELAIPFLVILQKGSPQVDEGSSDRIDGAKPGMIYNTVTGELRDQLEVIPCAKQRVFVEWIPRDDGGGSVGQYAPGSPEVLSAVPGKSARAMKIGENDLIETVYQFVLDLTEDGTNCALIGMSSTQLKAARQWGTMIEGARMTGRNGVAFKPPRYAYRYGLTTVLRSKDKWTWYTWQVERLGLVEDGAQYAAAKAYSASVQSGALQASTPPEDPGSSTKDDDSTPF